MFFCPLNSRRHESLGEAFLEHVDSVFDNGKVDVGGLENVIGEVAFEYALSKDGLVRVVREGEMETNRERVLIKSPRASR
jgi:hypothetical protein